MLRAASALCALFLSAPATAKTVAAQSLTDFRLAALAGTFGLEVTGASATISRLGGILAAGDVNLRLSDAKLPAVKEYRCHDFAYFTSNGIVTCSDDKRTVLIDLERASVQVFAAQ